MRGSVAGVDLSQFSTDDLRAMQGGDLSKVSTGGLRLLQSAMRQPRRAPETPAFEREARQTLETTPAELIAGSVPGRLALGAASPVLGAVQLIGNAFGAEAGKAVNDYLQRLEGMKRRGMEQQPSGYEQRPSAVSEALSDVDVAGGVGTMLNPGGLALAKALPVAASLGGRVAQGATMGATGAATQPVTENPEEFWSEKATQAGIGATVGGAIPAAVSAVRSTFVPAAKAAYHVLEPHLPGGTERVMARTLNTAAGSRQPQVVAELQANRQMVPGSMPTAGEAAAPAGSAEFSALQRIVADVDPSGYAQRAGEQGGARVAAVQGVGHDAATLRAAENARSATGGANYRLAFRQAVNADPHLAQLAKNPYFKDALPDAEKLSEASGISAKTDLTEFLHNVKLSLDKQLLREGEGALGSAEKRAVERVQKELVGWLAKKNPQYEAARATFARDSRPINQMEVGQYLEQKLLAPLGDKERPGVYAQALRDAPGTIKRATGSPRYERLDEVLDPAQVQAVEGVGQDLQRAAEYRDLASRGLPATRKQLGAQEQEIRLPNALHRPVMIANAILRRLQGKASEEVLQALAVKMRDPQEVARIMNQAPPQVRRAISEEAAAMARNMASGAAGTAYGQSF